jgi:probable rRNA maturation factor
MDPDRPGTVALTIDAPAWRRHLDDPEAICRRAVTAAFERVRTPSWLAHVELGVLLADDATLQRLNADHRGEDHATNVLSFPTFEGILDEAPAHLPPGPVPLGDVVLALETVCAEAAAERKPLLDHVSHLLVHGCLHLLGYDHQTAADAARMEGLERAILEQLGIADPYAEAAEPPAQPAIGRPPVEARS